MWIGLGGVFNSAQQAIHKVFRGTQVSERALLAKALFASGPALPQSPKLLSGISTGSASVVSDYTSLYRAAQNLAVEIWTSFPYLPLSFLKDFVSSKDVALGYHMFGSASSVGVITGLVALKKNMVQTKVSREIEDETGVLIGRLSQVKAGSSIAGGLSFAVFRPVSMYKLIEESPVGSLASRISQVSVSTGLVAYAILYTALSGAVGVQIHEANAFVHQLDHAGSIADQIAWVQAQINSDPKAIYAKLVEAHGSEAASEALINEALETAKSHLKVLMKELKIPKVSEERLLEVVKNLLRKGCSGWTQASVEKQMREELMSIGLQLKVQKTQLKQSAKMQRVLGKAGLDAVNEVKSLNGRVTKLDVISHSCIDTIRASAKAKISKNALLLAVCALGIASMVLSLVVTGGVSAVIASSVTLIYSVLMLILDSNSLYKSYKSERPGSHDKNMAILSTLIGVTSLLSLIALGVSGIMSMGLFPMLVAGILSAIWITQNMITYWVADRNEKNYQLKNPTLDVFLKAINDDRNKELVMKMFGNLPEDLKAKLQQALGDHKQDMKQAALAVAKKVEQAKKNRVEQLRNSLTPLLVNQLAS